MPNSTTPWSPAPVPRSGWSLRPTSRLTSPGSHCGYLGKCQICWQQGHSATQCSLYVPAPWQPSGLPLPPYTPRAHTASHQPPASPYAVWILDSVASHHATTDLVNLLLHSPYTAADNVIMAMVRDCLSHTRVPYRYPLILFLCT